VPREILGSSFLLHILFTFLTISHSRIHRIFSSILLTSSSSLPPTGKHDCSS
jgi:hypothetical protein